MNKLIETEINIIQLSRKTLEVCPNYRPEMKYGWVRTYVARRERMIRLFEKLDSLEI